MLHNDMYHPNSPKPNPSVLKTFLPYSGQKQDQTSNSNTFTTEMDKLTLSFVTGSIYKTWQS